MPDIIQSQHLQSTHYELRGKISALADQLANDDRPLLQLHLGNPGLFGLDAPEELLDAVRQNCRASQAYCHSKGLLQAREAILQHWQQQGLPPTSIENILIGNGVSELINVTLQALLNPGDEVLLPQPTYPLWSAATTLQGGICRYYRCDEQHNWEPNIEHLQSLITERTKAIVVINPNNPTGSVYSPACLQAIAKLATRHKLVLFADEIYSEIIYPPHQFEYMAPQSPECLTITFHGLSKNYLLAGYRCAWMVISGDTSYATDYIQGINKILAMRLCANVPAQYAIPLALSDQRYTLLQQYPKMLDKRNQVIARLNSIKGLSCHLPQGAFYAYPCWDPESCFWDHDDQWVLAFLQEHRILLAPGSTFAQPDPYHFRIVLLPTTDELLQACDKLEVFSKQHHGQRTTSS